MRTNCEVVGWLLVDGERPEVFIREEDGALSSQRADLRSTFGHQSVQTGAFRRGNPIHDPVTREMLGYEMEQISRPAALSA